VTVEDVVPMFERHLADVFDLDLVSAPDGIADAFRPVPV
jgi:hypothetical protein